MRQLRSCDFCDAGADLGVYEVVPDNLDAEGRRLVLCPHCRDRLDWVLDPFRDALDGGTRAAEDVTLLGVSDPGDAGDRSRATGDSGASPDERRDETSTGTSAADEGNDPPTGVSAEGGASTDDSTDAGGSTDDATAGTDENEPSARPAGASTAERSADDTPPKYRQVMRFLGNRDLPIDRVEAESLAAGAYDLEAGEATAIVDTALERGLLTEEDGQLRPN